MIGNFEMDIHTIFNVNECNLKFKFLNSTSELMYMKINVCEISRNKLYTYYYRLTRNYLIIKHLVNADKYW